MFADDFVGLTTNAEDLQKLVNVRVWYMFSGSVQHMTALEIISW